MRVRTEADNQFSYIS